MSRKPGPRVSGPRNVSRSSRYLQCRSRTSTPFREPPAAGPQPEEPQPEVLAEDPQQEVPAVAEGPAEVLLPEEPVEAAVPAEAGSPQSPRRRPEAG